MTEHLAPTLAGVGSRVTELRAELRQLERQLDTYDPSAPRRRARRRIAAIAALAIALVLPAGVLASHVFSDVPATNTFHANIANISRAGITTGCAVGKYCPKEFVTREQMAAFLNRAAGRGAFGYGTNEEIDNSGGNVAWLEITVPGAGWLHVTADGHGFTSETTGCPCVVDLDVYLVEFQEHSRTYSTVLDNSPGASHAYAHLGTNHAFSLPAAGTYTIEVWMYQSWGTADVFGDASVTALWVPFGSDGNANFGLEPNAD